MKAIMGLAQEITSALAEAVGLDKSEFSENFRLREQYAATSAGKVFEALEKVNSPSPCQLAKPSKLPT